jgi:Leucine-rich repeat (LRR) protein
MQDAAADAAKTRIDACCEDRSDRLVLAGLRLCVVPQTLLVSSWRAGLASLLRLDMRGNVLKALPTELCSSLPQLQQLRLSNNQLQELPENSEFCLCCIRFTSSVHCL